MYYKNTNEIDYFTNLTVNQFFRFENKNKVYKKTKSDEYKSVTTDKVYKFKSWNAKNKPIDKRVEIMVKK